MRLAMRWGTASQQPTDNALIRWGTSSVGSLRRRTDATLMASLVEWVNGKVYHCASVKHLGKPKRGSFMPEADAKARDAHVAHGKAC